MTATKTVTGTFNPGGTVTYTVVLSNAGPSTQTDNPGDEFTDVLPASLTLVSANASSGTAVATVGTNTVTWNGSLANGASVTITISATIAASTAAGTVVTNQGTASFDADGNGTNESSALTDDPGVAGPSNPTSFTVITPSTVTGTKTVTGTFNRGGAVTYTIVLSNAGPSAQADNPGNEFTDILPASLTLVSATASSGTAVATVGTSTVTWDGSLANGASVTITINATIAASTAPGTAVANQGTVSFDADGNGTNETTALTDDPGVAGAADATTFTTSTEPTVTATKTVVGTFTQGGTITYTIVISNSGSLTQADNAGNELTDILPAGLSLVSASATGGTAVATTATNTVTWNGEHRGRRLHHDHHWRHDQHTHGGRHGRDESGHGQFRCRRRWHERVERSDRRPGHSDGGRPDELHRGGVRAVHRSERGRPGGCGALQRGDGRRLQSGQ